MNQWLSQVRVGRNTKQSFGESDCKISYFNGHVAQVHQSDIPITHTTGGEGNIYGHGGGYISGRINPIRSHTEIKTNFKMWIRSKDNQDFSWSSDWAPDIATGQQLTLIFLANEFVAYVNHNTQSWIYVKSDNEIASIAGQRGYLVMNSDEIKESKERQENGLSSGFLAGCITFWTALFVEKCAFWGWRWMEEPSSRYWYIFPGLLFLGAFQAEKIYHFSLGLLFSIGLGLTSWYFGYERWGAISVLLLTLSILYEPEKSYGLYIDRDALSKVKRAIENNAHYALRNFR